MAEPALRALVLGGSGLLGRSLVAEGPKGSVDVLGLSRHEAPLEEPERLDALLADEQAGVVVNAAALTDVDGCESRREEARFINGEAVGGLLEVCRRQGARLVQISTDYVFDGTAKVPYREADPTAPLSVYGESKLLGERLALEDPSSLVVRTSWLFGLTGKSFVTTMIGLMNRGDRRLRVVDDQVGCPTFTPHLARAIWDLVRREAGGIVHYRDRDPVSWCGFAREIVRRWAPEVRVEAIRTEEMPRPARRPSYSVLDVSRAEALLGRPVASWKAGLEATLQAERAARS